MNKIILVPDSFKGTMSSIEVCRIMAERIRAHFPGSQIISVPMADGGEGTVDAVLSACGGERRSRIVQGPYGEAVSGFWGLLPDGRTAVIEMACCAGLPLVAGRENPALTNTFGVGQLILTALQEGAKKVILGLGGSATNDGGCGAACALGARFIDENGNSFVPTGGILGHIAHIDLSSLLPEVHGAEIIIMCDVNSPLYGPEGAAAVFAPQKGADTEMVSILDSGLRHLSNIIRRDLGIDVSTLPGSGAAGGMGAGLCAFLGAHLARGAETVLGLADFDNLLDGCDAVFTGEGKLDTQSLRGKVVQAIASRAKHNGVPVIVVAGDVEIDIENLYEAGVTAVFSINNIAVDFDKAKHRGKHDLAFTMDNILRLCRYIESTFQKQRIEVNISTCHH